MARALGVHGYGRLSLAVAIAGIVGQLADFGLGQGVAQLAAARPKDAARIAWAAVTMFAIRSSVAAVVACALGFAFYDLRTALVIAILALAAPMSATSVLIGVSNARDRPEIGPLTGVVQSLIWAATGIPLALVVPSPAAIGLALVAANAVQSLATMYLVSGRHISFVCDRAVRRTITRKSWAPGFLGLLVTAYYRLSAIIVFGVAGSAALGVYSACYRFIEVGQVIPAALVAPLVPKLVRVSNVPSYAGAVLTQAVKYALMLGGALACILLGAGGELLRLLFGAQYVSGKATAAWLGVAFIGVCLEFVFMSAALALGVASRQIRFVAPLAAVSVLSQFLFVHLYGIAGAALVTALTEVGIAAVAAHQVSRIVRMSWRAARLPAIATALCLASVAGPLVGHGWWVIGVTGFVYVTLLLALRVTSVHGALSDLGLRVQPSVD